MCIGLHIIGPIVHGESGYCIAREGAVRLVSTNSSCCCVTSWTTSNGVFAGNLKHQRNTIILTIIANNILIGWLWFGSYSLFGGVLALGHFSTWVNEISVGLEQDKTRNITEGGKGPKPEISQDRSMGPKSSNTMKGQKGPNSKKTVDQNHKD